MRPQSLADGSYVEFSLALHAKTGKYFIGRDLIASNASRIRGQLFWRFTLAEPPRDLIARIIGRLLAIEVDLRVREPWLDRALPRRRPPRPVVHMDPHTVLLHDLSPGDVVLCHDVGPLTHPALFGAEVVAAYRKAYDEIAAAGPHMVFVSETSRSAFHARFGPAFASSRVIYPAIRTEVASGTASPADGVEQPFILTVGSVGDRKNQLGAIKAFAASGLSAEGVQYVLCGGKEPGYEAVAAEAARTSGVRLLSYVSDETLNWLYGKAAGFVLVSHLEGFGIPVAEAIARGLTPLVSASSVLQEVAGEGALLANPDDVQAIARMMRHLVHMPSDERRDRLEKLTRSIERFSLEGFAGQWRELLDQPAA